MNIREFHGSSSAMSANCKLTQPSKRKVCDGEDSAAAVNETRFCSGA